MSEKQVVEQARIIERDIGILASSTTLAHGQESIRQAERRAKVDAQFPPTKPRQCIRIKRNGDRCRAWSCKGHLYCQKHGGGKSSVRRAIKSQTHGRYSKYLPTGLATKYEECRRDPYLLSLKEEISLMDALIQETTERYKDEGVRIDSKGIDQVTKLSVQRRKLAESERKYMQERGMMITVPQMMTMLNYIANLFKQIVEDDAMRVEFAHRLRQDILIEARPDVDYYYKEDTWDK